MRVSRFVKSVITSIVQSGAPTQQRSTKTPISHVPLLFSTQKEKYTNNEAWPKTTLSNRQIHHFHPRNSTSVIGTWPWIMHRSICRRSSSRDAIIKSTRRRWRSPAVIIPPLRRRAPPHVKPQSRRRPMRSPRPCSSSWVAITVAEPPRRSRWPRWTFPSRPRVTFCSLARSWATGPGSRGTWTGSGECRWCRWVLDYFPIITSITSIIRISTGIIIRCLRGQSPQVWWWTGWCRDFSTISRWIKVKILSGFIETI